MCKNIDTAECAGDCKSCGSLSIHQPDADKIFEKLKKAANRQTATVGDDENTSRHRT